MDNKFHNFEKNISLDDINEVEENLDYLFPKEFKELYLVYNGGTPEKCCWVDQDSELDYLEIASFISFKFCERQHNNPDYLIEGIYKKMVEKNIIPAHIVPFARDWGGNFFCLKMTDNSIIYYVTDDFGYEEGLNESHKDRQCFLNSSFEDFLRHLVTEDDALEM